MTILSVLDVYITPATCEIEIIVHVLLCTSFLCDLSHVYIVNLAIIHLSQSYQTQSLIITMEKYVPNVVILDVTLIQEKYCCMCHGF